MYLPNQSLNESDILPYPLDMFYFDENIWDEEDVCRHTNIDWFLFLDATDVMTAWPIKL